MRSLPAGPACGYDPRAVGRPERRRPPGRLAQWLEHAVHIRGVTGSNPVSPTIVNPNRMQGLRALFLFSGRWGAVLVLPRPVTIVFLVSRLPEWFCTEMTVPLPKPR
jgi:hypothetical protein